MSAVRNPGGPRSDGAATVISSQLTDQQTCQEGSQLVPMAERAVPGAGRRPIDGRNPHQAVPGTPYRIAPGTCLRALSKPPPPV